ncbi:MAG: DNA translocase FtsK 4TM domain-containing protein, partial [Lentisphaeria bacterium]
MTKKKTEKNKSQQLKNFPIIRNFVVATLFLAFAIFLLLSLLSFNINDLQLINNGFNLAQQLPKNWFGFIGAKTAQTLFFLFGGVAFIIPIIILICSIRRMFLGQVKCHWEYFLGIWLMIIGITIFMGLYPTSITNPLTAVTTDRTLAAGVIGQRFSNPTAPLGWIFRVLNHGGCQLAASFLFIGGFSIIWINDWHLFFKNKLKNAFAQKTNNPNKIKKVAKEESTVKQPQSSPKSSFFSRIFAFNSNKNVNIENNNDIFKNIDKRNNKKPLQPTLELINNDSQQNNYNSQNFDSPSPKPKPSATFSPKLDGSYQLPDINLLAYDQKENAGANQQEIEIKRDTLQSTFYNFRVDAEVTNVVTGPRVTLFEITPAPGVNVASITKLRNNIAMDMKAESLRILAPIPGKGSVGIEVPNSKATPVSLRKLLESNEWRNKDLQIPLALGRGIAGDAICLDLAKAPHLLIAGATGSGKSVCMNTIIASMLYRFSPDELKLILVDPKVVEFKNYETLPHLVTPVVNDPKRVTLALNWAVKEMDRRYRILAKVGVKNLETFNNR